MKPYPERQRDWPYDARQPLFYIVWCQFQQSNIALRDEEEYILYSETLPVLGRVFYFLRL